jgi:hypothetical protein
VHMLCKHGLKVHHKKTPWLESVSELYRRSNHCLSAKLVPIFANRGCHVVIMTDPSCCNSRVSRPKPLLFLSSSSSIVLPRLSGPCSRPTIIIIIIIIVVIIIKN